MQSNKCNAKLIKYSPPATKVPLLGAVGAPDGGFGGGGAVFDEFGHAFACFVLFFGLENVF